MFIIGFIFIGSPIFVGFWLSHLVGKKIFPNSSSNILNVAGRASVTFTLGLIIATVLFASLGYFHLLPST